MVAVEKNPKKKMVTLDLRAFLFIILVPVLSVIVIISLLIILTTKKEPVDEIASAMTGIYYGNNTYIEGSGERIVKKGYSSSEYMELKEDWTCKTNIEFPGSYEYVSGNCIWGINEDPSKTNGYRYHLDIFKDSLVRFGGVADNYHTVWFNYDDNDREIIVYSSVLKRK